MKLFSIRIKRYGARKLEKLYLGLSENKRFAIRNPGYSKDRVLVKVTSVQQAELLLRKAGLSGHIWYLDPIGES